MATKKTRSKPKTKTAKQAVKTVMGRPSKYRAAYADQVRKLALLGLTDRGMANFFCISESTLNLWKKEHSDFSESLKSGKEDADARIAAAMYHSALGGGTVTELKEETDEDGKVVYRKTVKELPANVSAQIFWLKNRQPRLWREKIILEDETPPETLLATANQFVEIMARARDRQRQVLIDRGILKPDDEA